MIHLYRRIHSRLRKKNRKFCIMKNLTLIKVAPASASVCSLHPNTNCSCNSDSDSKPEKPSEKLTVIAETKIFLEKIGIYGMQHVMTTNFAIQRMLWVLVLLAAASFTAYQVCDRIAEFRSNPVDVNMFLQFSDFMEFPTVTICNENRARKSVCDFFNMTAFVREAFPIIYSNSSGSTSNAVNFTTINLEQLYRAVAHRPSDAILQCSFGGQRCTADNFTIVPTEMGICFQFNGDRGAPLVLREKGAQYGLDLLLDVEQAEYWAPESLSAGFRMTLHNINELPKLTSDAFILPVGFETHVSTTVTKITRVPPPYEACGTKTLAFYPKYSKTSCEVECFSNFTVDECGCVHWLAAGTIGRVCSPQEFARCLLPAHGRYVRDLKEQECGCTLPCDEIIYTPTSSYAPFSKLAVQELQGFTGNKYTATEVRENLLKISVFYKQLAYNSVKSTPAYTATQLLCDVGGALGLFLGSTLLTAYEILDFVVFTAFRHRFKTDMSSPR